MKSLYLTFDDNIFEDLKKKKEKLGLTWEKFILNNLRESIFEESGATHKVRNGLSHRK